MLKNLSIEVFWGKSHQKSTVHGQNFTSYKLYVGGASYIQQSLFSKSAWVC